MKVFFNILKRWSSVIVLSAILACHLMAFICCVFSSGRVYPIFGAMGVFLAIGVLSWQLVLEIKSNLSSNGKGDI